jgi:GTPase
MNENESTAGAPSVTRAGYAALVGLPNAGKSSLMNRLLDQPLSIVTPVAQTTRSAVTGIDTTADFQIVYVDTPGLVRPKHLLHRAMLRIALDAIPDVDVVVLVVDASAPLPKLEEDAIDRLRARRADLVVALNKVDLTGAAALSDARTWAETLGPRLIVEVSAETGAGVDALRESIAARLPESPFFYPADEISSQPVRFFVAEFIRETVLERYHQEIPHSVFVEIEEFREADSPIFIRANIHVERPTQKQILIGRGGAAIKELGSAARAKIEAFVGAPIYLDLWIKVLPRWRKHAPTLRRLGFPVPKTED